MHEHHDHHEHHEHFADHEHFEDEGFSRQRFGPGGPGGGGGPRGGRGRRGGGGRRDQWRGAWIKGPAGAHFARRVSRAARGDVRAAVLTLVAEEPMHGYQIIRELSERSGGVWTPSPGSIYPTLQLLSDEGLVSSEETEGRRVYAATDAGRAVLAERGTGRPTPWEEVAADADSSVLGVRQVAIQVMAAVRQVVHAGSESDIASATTLLTETRRALYRILAESTGEEPGGPSPEAPSSSPPPGD